MDIEPVLRNRGQGDHGCPPGWGFPLPSTNLPESLPSSKSSPPFTVKIRLFGKPLSLAKFAVLSAPITNAPVLLAM